MKDPVPDVLGKSPDEIANRLMQRAHNRDGLPEIAIGGGFGVIGFLIYTQALLERGSSIQRRLSLILVLLIPLLGFALPWSVKWARRRFLLDRVGYFEPKPVRLSILGLSIAIAASVAVLVAIFSHPLPSLILVCSGVFGGSLAALAGKMPRFIACGVLVAAAGILLGLSGVSLEIGMALLWGFAGLVFLISGSVVLMRFIREPREDGE